MAAINTTSVGTSKAAAMPATDWAMFIMPASVLIAISAIAAPCPTALT